MNKQKAQQAADAFNRKQYKHHKPKNARAAVPKARVLEHPDGRCEVLVYHSRGIKPLDLKAVGIF